MTACTTASESKSAARPRTSTSPRRWTTPSRRRGEYVCLLNNDTIVTAKWLDALTGLAQVSPSHGMVGPMSNCAPEGQRVETVPYRLGPKKGAKPSDPLIDVAAVDAFARDYHGEMRGKWIEIDALGGFCLLIRREVLTRIRPALAKWTDLNLFDTDIAGKKARQEGFKLVVCRDLFIHHFGTRTFAHGAPAPEGSMPAGMHR